MTLTIFNLVMRRLLPVAFFLSLCIPAFAQTNNPLLNKKIPSVDIKDIKGDPLTQAILRTTGNRSLSISGRHGASPVSKNLPVLPICMMNGRRKRVLKSTPSLLITHALQMMLPRLSMEKVGNMWFSSTRIPILKGL